MAMTELALAGAKAGAAEPVVIDAALAAPSAGNGSICTGPRLSLSIAIYVASRPEICRRVDALLRRPPAAPVLHAVYRTRFFGHKFELSGLFHSGFLPGDTCVVRTATDILTKSEKSNSMRALVSQALS